MKMSYNNLRLLVAGCLLLGGIPLWAAGAGLFNLPETPKETRFKLTDRDWPAKPGEASICLWNDDKLAAFSVTIDDNCAMDVPWWLEQSKNYQIKLTWFLITGNVGETPTGPHPKMSGVWSLWKSVLDAGNAVESHSVTHGHGVTKNAAGEPVPPEGWKGVDWEYSESIKQIEAGIPGHKVHFLAYPGGASINDPNVAPKYYLAIRGANGINPPNQIAYMKIRYTPSVEDMEGHLDPKHKAYRGWAVMINHYVGNDQAKARVHQWLETYKKHESEFWGGLFGDVARYGQERDTAKLVVDENSSTQIAFTLTDQMNDEFYDYPLTIKVRLPDDWKAVKAVQQEKEVSVTILEKDGGKFALVKAVPDRGKVVMTIKQ